MIGTQNRCRASTVGCPNEIVSLRQLRQ
jgi:hypothetical protein